MVERARLASANEDAAAGDHGDVESTDGRTRRREENRRAVLDAAIELFGEDNLQPAPEDVARRSGVSLRSVYRFYSDRNDLLQAAIDRHYEQMEPLLELPDQGKGTLPDRVDRFVTARLRLYEAVAPVARAARAAASQREAIRERLELVQRLLREQMEGHFAAELGAMSRPDHRAVAAAIDALFQLEALDHLRVGRRLSSSQAADVLRISLARLLATG